MAGVDSASVAVRGSATGVREGGAVGDAVALGVAEGVTVGAVVGDSVGTGVSVGGRVGAGSPGARKVAQARAVSARPKAHRAR